ncbi:hypothetical protein M9Y10_021978 [Tritrichomonas musculus]|uniref:Uncharacterized protein n=1 Tax=Tritrichomonas musculus TaxID=1915356 RepID=A0ABR2KU86_9EUKA
MNEQITRICDSCLLLKIIQGGGRYLQHYVPQTYDINDQIQIILVNSFQNNKNSSSIYAFTTQSNTCYVFNFVYDSIPYSIVLLSSIRCPLIFLKFLQDMRKTIENSKINNEENKIEPMVRMTLIWSILQSWHFIDKNEAVVTFSSTPFHAILSSSYSQFSPFNFFSADTNYLQVWRTLLTGGRILIVSNGATPKQMTYATFGIASLSSEFPFSEKILLCQNSQDPRLFDRELIKEYKIICAPEMPNCFNPDDYDVTLQIQMNKLPIDAFQKIIQARNKRLYDIVSYLIQTNLISDPYSNFLEKDICDEYKAIINPETMEKILNDKQFYDFTHSGTFKSWRKDNLFNDEFRDAFLSTQPEVALVNKTEEELLKCSSFIDIIKNHYSFDIHMVSVCKRHKKLIKRLLNGEKIEIQKPEPVVISSFQLNCSSDEI